MVTLKQIFQVFGHDPKWARFAAASAQPMVSVFFRKLGDRDITTLTDFDIQLQLAVSEQPEDRKAKARSCMDQLRTWAAEQGKPFAQPEHEPEPPNQGDRSMIAHNDRITRPVPLIEPKPKPTREKRIVKRCEKQGDIQQPLRPAARTSRR